LCRYDVNLDGLANATGMRIKAYRKKKTDFNIRAYGELPKAQLSESSIIQRLSCSMRLTQQSNFHQSRRLPGPAISNRILEMKSGDTQTGVTTVLGFTR
jgi:hypothetical protein